MQVAAKAKVNNAGESLRSKQSVTTRVTEASVRRRLSDQLTSLDFRVIDTLNTVRMATGAQLRRLYWPDTDTGKRLARHHFAKLTKLRLIARLDRRIGGVRSGSEGFTYALDVAGQRLVDHGTTKNQRKRRPSTPGARYLDHALAVTERYIELCEQERAHVFEIIGFEAEPDSWRRYAAAHGAAQTIKPDAFVIIADVNWEHRWFIEVDRATEHRPTILRKANEYIRYWRSGIEQHTSDIFPKVIWVVPNDRRADQLTDWLQTLDSSVAHIFDVCTDANFGPTIGSAMATVEGSL